MSKLLQLGVRRPLTLLCTIAGLAVLSLVYFGAPLLSSHIVEGQAIGKAQCWQSDIVHLLDNGDSTFTMQEVTNSDRTALDVFIRISESYRYLLLAADGKIFASSNREVVGKTQASPAFSEAVSKGTITVERETKLRSEVDKVDENDTIQSREIIEIYVPVRRDGEIVGAIKHYFDATQSIASLTETIHYSVVSLLVVAVLFGSTIVGQIVVHSRTQRRLQQNIHEAEMKHLEKLSERNEETIILSDLNDWLQSSQSLEELYEMVSAFLTKLLPGCPGSIYTYSNSRDILERACSWNDGAHAQNMQADDCWGLRRGRIYNFGAHKVDFVCKHKPDDVTGRYCCIPIVAHGETVGLLHLEPRAACNVDIPEGVDDWEDCQRIAAIAAEQISLAIANVRLRDQLRDQSIRDPLTGLYNRRYLMEGLHRELARAERKGESVAILSFDIDYFKRFNDNHGHDAGDTVLRTVGETIHGEFRDEDIACRFGGEEFVVAIPGSGVEHAASRAEDLRTAIERITVRYGGAALPPVTVSIGVATMPDCGTSAPELLQCADRALYKAKDQGRNCVVLANEIAQVPDKPVVPEPEEDVILGVSEQQQLELSQVA